MTWVAHDIRDALVDFIDQWATLTELPAHRFMAWLELSRRKFSCWRERYGKCNEHNARVPRDHWLERWEIQAIIAFFHQFPLEGHRRLASTYVNVGGTFYYLCSALDGCSRYLVA